MIRLSRRGKIVITIPIILVRQSKSSQTDGSEEQSESEFVTAGKHCVLNFTHGHGLSSRPRFASSPPIQQSSFSQPARRVRANFLQDPPPRSARHSALSLSLFLSLLPARLTRPPHSAHCCKNVDKVKREKVRTCDFLIVIFQIEKHPKC